MSRPEKIRDLWKDWPVTDRAAWERAIEPGRTKLSMTGKMARLRDRSIEIYSREASYGRNWAIQNGFPAGLEHARLWTPSTLPHYISYLKEQGLRSGTIRMRLLALERVMAAVAPDVDCGFILSEVNALRRPDIREEKRERMRSQVALLECGIALMENALPRIYLSLKAYVQFRTGLQIALLSLRPYRLQVFTEIEWWPVEPPEGHTSAYLIARLGKSWICFRDGPHNSKSTPVNQPLPERLIPWLQRYLELHADIFGPGAQVGARLWRSTRCGGALGANGLYKQIVAKTRDVFGVAVNPHLFRDCYSTSASERSAAQGAGSHLALANTSQIDSRVYDQSDNTTIALEMARFMEELTEGELAVGLQAVPLSKRHSDR